MQAGTVAFDEPADWRLWRRRFEQLESRLAHRDEHGAHVLARHVVGGDTSRPSASL